MALDGGQSLLRKRFEAAVKTIQNLPKNGSYQPSHSVQLKFYSLYKQANNGPVKSSRPSMFDVVGRAKWDAWKALGDMSAEEAMQAYVDEIMSVAGSMADSPEKDQFLSVMREPAPAPPAPAQAIQEAEEEPASNLNQDGAEPEANATESVPLHSGPKDSRVLEPAISNPLSVLSETDNDDEFCDTMETLNTDDEYDGDADTPTGRNGDWLPVQQNSLADGGAHAQSASSPLPESSPAPSRHYPADSSAGGAAARGVGMLSSTAGSAQRSQQAASGVPGQSSAAVAASDAPPATVGYISPYQSTGGRVDVTSAAAATHASLGKSLQALTTDVTAIDARLADVEAGLQGVRAGKADVTTVRENRGPSWWPLRNWNARTALAFFLWPFFVNFVMSLVGNRRQRRT